MPLRSNRRGVTLIMVAGVLAVLAALGAGFYVLMLSQTHSATRYSDSVRAQILAQSGIEDAIGRLREQAYFKPEDPADPWFTVDYLHDARRRISFPDFKPSQFKPGTPGAFASYTRSLGSVSGPSSERYTLVVTDAAGKININACDNLGVLLDNLCRLIGAPLVAADLNMLQPARWAAEGAAKGDYGQNTLDTVKNRDLYHEVDPLGKGTDPITGYPSRKADGSSIYGDGYAIAAYRARNGLFKSIEDLRLALPVVPQPAHPELESLEREVKFSALRDYVTIDSWIDTDTACVGKFEWVDSNGVSLTYADPNGPSASLQGSLKLKSGQCQILIDRDKSWVSDDPKNDPQNLHGSLRGCYVSIINGHGSGQLRRIATNGADWIALEMTTRMHVEPGPISSYMIIAKEDALTETVDTQYGKVAFPKTDNLGRLIDDPAIDYSVRPLCIHRAPVNINTASDKVLAALFLGINVQHGHPSSVGTDADIDLTQSLWTLKDKHHREDVVLTPKGLKRVPVSPGKPVLNRPRTWPVDQNINLDYICNYGTLGSPNFSNSKLTAQAVLSEAHELASRIIVARQRSLDPATGLAKAPGTPDLDPNTLDNTNGLGFERGPFRSWDDLYFRVVKPWDDIRSFPKGEKVPHSGKTAQTGQGKASVARLIMAHFNSNTDILKFNPNIEWIDRWGRNFTEMEPVMVYTDDPEKSVSITTNGKSYSCVGHGKGTKLANPIDDNSRPIFALEADGGGKVLGVPGAPDNDQGAYVTRSYRYKSDELIDKTDLNRSTTEFSFDSNGIFAITSLGQVVNDGAMLAERRADALVKVYGVWRESTQRQFVNGVISQSKNQNLAFRDSGNENPGNYSGSIVRDAKNKILRLALNTQPEPLVPVQYRATKKFGRPNAEVLDDTFRDAYGNTRKNPNDSGAPASEVPDILANRVLPAGYDGQIVLATNTLSFDPSKSGDWDTFLASYDGDLDSTTCVGNGRELAKTPNNSKIRVIDAIGLLGLLNDTELDTDVSITGKPYVPGGVPPNGVKVYPFANVSAAMEGLDTRPLRDGRTPYWQNAMCRMGDLRSDGVFVSGPGVGGNDGTLKYAVGEAKAGVDSHENFDLNNNEGNSISMWAKTAWHYNDNRTHEFFNCTGTGAGRWARACYLVKDGRTKWCTLNGTAFGISDAGARNNDYGFIFEGQDNIEAQNWQDEDFPIYLHGGYTGVPQQRLHQYDSGKANTPEAPSFRIQPFRWQYLGGKINYGPLNKIFAPASNPEQQKYTMERPPNEGGPNPPLVGTGRYRKEGYLDGNQDQHADAESIDMAYMAAYWLRPFVDSERYPEGPGFAPAGGGLTKGNLPNTLKYKFWGCWEIRDGRPWAARACFGDWVDFETGKSALTEEYEFHGGMGQPVAWPWANGYKKGTPRVFGMNNLNLGDPTNYYNPDWSDPMSNFYNIYRHLIEDGTYAVIDEFKISSRTDMLCGSKDRITREQTTSRYYLPSDPSKRSTDAEGCPYFTSQTMLESLKGSTSAQALEQVVLARVTWTVFTPRFMHEYKTSELSGFKRKNQYLTRLGSSPLSPMAVTIPFKGPFDYDLYNNDDMISGPLADAVDNFRINRHASVARPYPYEYPGGQSHSTKGVEIELLNDTTKISGAREQHRSLGDFTATDTFIDPDVENRLGDLARPAIVNAAKLRYRVRFVYPVDPLVNKNSAKIVAPVSQYLLDTPVFDDISITYFTKPRIISYRWIDE